VEEKDVKGLKLKNVKTGMEDELPVKGLFLGIGHEPNAKMFEGQMDLDEDGYIKTTGNVLTTSGQGDSRSVCVRRRAGPALPAGDYGRGIGMHGCA